MPSTVDPSTIASGPGKLHVDVANAAADLFTNISSSLLSSLSSLLTQPLAAPTILGGQVGTNNSSVTIASTNGPFYVGDNVGDSLQDLFKVVQESDDTDIFNRSTLAYVTVTSISPATVGSGFTANNLTLNFNTPIPNGVNYKIVYGRRVTVGNLPVELSSNPVIRRSPERVRFPEVPRTGLAPTSVAAPLDIVANDYPDPYMAQWKAVLRGSAASPNLAFGGSAGFVNVGTKKNVNDSDDAAPAGGQGSAFLAVYEKNIVGTGTVGSGNPSTRINASNTATLNPGGGNSSLVELAASDFFRTGTDTAIHLGVDMLEITFSDATKECYVILAIDLFNARRATVSTLGGATPNFGTAVSVTVKWIRTNFFVGGDNDSSALTNFAYKGLYHCVPSNITDAPDTEIVQAPPFFSSAQPPKFTAVWGQYAFTWGYHYQSTTEGVGIDAIGTRNVKGELWGDGSVHSKGRIIGMPSQQVSPVSISSTFGLAWDPKGANLLLLNFTGSNNNTLTLNFSPAYTALASTFADEITIVVNTEGVTPDSAGEDSTVIWPAGFKFSGNDGNITGPAGRVMIFRGVLLNGTTWYLTRTDYV